MNAKRTINKDHVDYPEYIEKCRKLSEIYISKEEAEEAKYPGWKGLDHPAAREVFAIKKQFHAELEKLQEEYAHLFTQAPEE